MSVNIYGLSGLSLELLSPLGKANYKTVINKFQEDIRTLLETKRGTLIGDPAFGSNLIDLLFEPANEATAALIRQEVAVTIEKYYSNITITQVDVTFRKNTVKLLIHYTITNTNIGDTIMLEFISGSVL